MRNKIATKLVLIFLLIAMITSVSVVAVAEGEPANEVNRVTIMHLTDPHYIPTYYCYTGDKKENDFATKIKGDPKLMLESYAVLEASIDMVKKANPDYLLVTGDITSNGEKQSLVDSANALRKLQNDLRAAGNTDFQVLVVPGNHDVFNNRHAADYSSGIKVEAPCASRLEFAKIFSSLGFPDLTDEEAKAFYTSEEWSAVNKHLPYEANGDVAFINSTTNPKLKFEYYADLNDSAKVDPLGGLTYICYDDENKLSFVGFDTNLSVKDNQRTEGEYTKENIDWYCAKDLSKYTQISMAHHNMIKHFSVQEQFVPKFITYGWEEIAERLVSNGVRYSFTGHFHSNDMATYTSITNNNLMYEIETGATISYGAAVRETAIVDYEDGTQDFESETIPVDKADFTYLVENNLMPEGFKDCLDKNNMCDIQKYISKKLFTPWLYNIVDSFISPQKLGPMIDGLNLKVAGIDLQPVVKKLLSEINDKALKDYTYKGDNEKLQAEDAKVYAYLNELILKGIKTDVALGKNLNDLLIYSYGQNLMGGEVQQEKNLPGWIKDAYKKFRSGKGVEDVFETLIYDENGLYNLVSLIANSNIDLSEFNILNTVFSVLGIDNVDLANIKLNELAPKAFEGLKEKGMLDLGVTGKTLMEDVDQLLETYLNDSFYKGFGRVLVDISKGFCVDDSFDGEMNKVITYKANPKDLHSFNKEGKNKEQATTSNGRLPSQITITMGKNPTSEVNAVWFTSKFAPKAELQYKVVDTEEWISVKASSEVVPYPATMFDFGFFISTIDKNILRNNVKLTGLKENTEYYYRVGYKDEVNDNEVWSEIGSFKTAPSENQAFDVAIFAEMQQMDNLSYEEMLNKLIESKKLYDQKNPNFVISMGDLVDNSLSSSQWDYALNTLHPYFKDTISVVVPGKQDNKSYESGKKNPAVNVDIEKMKYDMMDLHYDLNAESFKEQKNYFSFDYSAVHFIVLDTNDITKNKLGKEQVKWLEDDLKATTKPFKVVLMHKGIYSPGTHVNNAEIVGLRNQLSPIFYNNKVNIVFSGYEHIYAETKLLDAEGKEALDGVLYVTVGRFGDKGKKYVTDVDFPVAFGEDLHYPNLETNTFVKLSYDGEELNYQGFAFKDFYFVRVQDYPAMRLIGLWISLAVFAVLAIAGAITAAVVINKNKKKMAQEKAQADDGESQDIVEKIQEDVIQEEVIDEEPSEEDIQDNEKKDNE